MALDATANFVKVTVSTGYNASATSIVLSSGQGALLPAAPFNLTWWNVTDYADPSDDPNVEIVRVTNIATDTLTVTRATEGPAASTKNTAGKTYKMLLGITTKMITDIGANLYKAAQTPAAVTGTIDGSNKTFTLPWTPADPASVTLWLNQQPYFYNVHFTLSGTTVTYGTAPDASFAGTGHYATGH